MVLFPHWSSLSLAQQVAQMVVVRASGHLFDHQIQYPQWEPSTQTLRHWVQDWGVGGVIFLGGSAAEIALRTQQLREWAITPLLLAADIEEGVGQRFTGATEFPPPMALGEIAKTDLQRAIALAEAMGVITAQEALAVGLNWILAPTCDVNNNPANPVINVRAFGDAPEQVSHLVTAFIKGAHRHPALTCAKHFPGHGDTATDSHLELPLIPHSLQRLHRVEQPPFKAAIAAGVDAVMSAHLLIPALDDQFPATLSRRILTEELRQNLGFSGMAVTDALVMGAIANRYGANEAPVMAVEAGADILLMPVDPEGAIRALCDAVESGRIGYDRIATSVERIWQAKQKLWATVQGDTTHAWENLSTPPLQLERVAQPEAIATAHQILKSSMRVHLPTSARLGRVTTSPHRNLIILDDALNCEWLTPVSAAIALPQHHGYTLQVVDRNTPPVPLSPQDTVWPTLLQLFIRGNPFRGSAGLSQTARGWFEALLERHQLQALVIYGSPYILEEFLPALPADIPYVFTYGQMPDAQAIALQTLFGVL